MPQTRYIEEYKDSKLINKIPFEVSDEELVKEQKVNRLNELKNKANFTAVEIQEVIKLLLSKV